MLYVVKITTDPNVPKDKPKETKVKIYEEVITKVGVYFPPGPQLLTGVALFYGNYQIFPFKENDWVIGDNVYIEGRVYWKLSLSII